MLEVSQPHTYICLAAMARAAGPYAKFIGEYVRANYKKGSGTCVTAVLAKGAAEWRKTHPGCGAKKGKKAKGKKAKKAKAKAAKAVC